MNLSNLEKSWQQILVSTQTLEQSAAQEDWPLVAELAASRHQLITQHFKLYPVGPNTAEFYQKHLSSFLIKEEQLQKLAIEARKASMKASIKFNTNKKAVSAYREA
ncbi:MAG: hypothetical protein V3T17_09290 [Pseudomonadales bacterium]